jgi:hypothetical protein
VFFLAGGGWRSWCALRMMTDAVVLPGAVSLPALLSVQARGGSSCRCTGCSCKYCHLNLFMVVSNMLDRCGMFMLLFAVFQQLCEKAGKW